MLSLLLFFSSFRKCFRDLRQSFAAHLTTPNERKKPEINSERFDYFLPTKFLDFLVAKNKDFRFQRSKSGDNNKKVFKIAPIRAFKQLPA